MRHFDITGAENLLFVSKALKVAGDLGMRREVNAGLRTVARPLIEKTRAAARAELPKRGGLNELVARAPQRVRIATGARTYGVAIVVGSTKSGAQGANRGKLRHPVFGRDMWVTQAVPSGWFDDTLRKNSPLVREALEGSLLVVRKQILDRRG